MSDSDLKSVEHKVRRLERDLEKTQDRLKDLENWKNDHDKLHNDDGSLRKYRA
jgi:hypothetical protein